MSQADDILFEPVTQALPFITLDSTLLNDVDAALKGIQDIEFSVDSSTPIAVYDKIVDLVENDPDQITFLYHMTYIAGLSRPSNALVMKDVFRRVMAGEMNFYHCGKAHSGGSRVGEFHFKNIFGIASRHPYLLLDKGSNRYVSFEWWAASLISGRAGYMEHYSFATRDEADKYYHSP